MRTELIVIKAFTPLTSNLNNMKDDLETLLGYEIHEPMRKTKEPTFGEVLIAFFLILLLVAVVIDIGLTSLNFI